jgi:hypothetical protein
VPSWSIHKQERIFFSMSISRLCTEIVCLMLEQPVHRAWCSSAAHSKSSSPRLVVAAAGEGGGARWCTAPPLFTAHLPFVGPWEGEWEGAAAPPTHGILQLLS